MEINAAGAMPAYTASYPVVRIPLEQLSSQVTMLEAELASGHRVELVRGDHVIAQVLAVLPLAPPKPETGRAMPDFRARLVQMWGDTPLDVDTTTWVREDRDGDEHVS